MNIIVCILGMDDAKIHSIMRVLIMISFETVLSPPKLLYENRILLMSLMLQTYIITSSKPYDNHGIDNNMFPGI